MVTSLNIRLPASEVEMLRRYCLTTQRSKTEVVRSFVRSLEQTPKGSKPKKGKAS